jgi:hypothetical protein
VGDVTAITPVIRENRCVRNSVTLTFWVPKFKDRIIKNAIPTLKGNTKYLSEIWALHGSEHDDGCLLSCNAV